MFSFKKYKKSIQIIRHATNTAKDIKKIWSFLYKRPKRLIKRYERIKEITTGLKIKIPIPLVKMRLEKNGRTTNSKG